MDISLLLAIGLVLILLVLVAMSRRKQGVLERMNSRKTDHKEQRKDDIMKLFDSKERISHEDIDQILEVSGKTIRNYLDELEAERKITQHGRTGRGVYYTKKR